MPKKRNVDRTYGEKLISLFAALFFTGRSYALTELANMLDCSKQTVLRMVDDVTRAYEMPIKAEMKGNRRYFSIERPRWARADVPMTPMEISVMQMCQAFTVHLLGWEQFEASTRAIQKSRSLLSHGQSLPDGFFAAFSNGRVDYTPHQGTIRTIIEAMEEKVVCKVQYKRLMASKAKTHYVKPLKLISHGDTLYLHCRIARTPGKKYKAPDYDPLFAVHRVQQIEKTKTPYEYPKDYDFEKAFEQSFGVIKKEPFEVTVEFSGWAAEHVGERIWSVGQRIEVKKKKAILTFMATSAVEVTGWVLWFGKNAVLLHPKWLIERYQEEVAGIASNLQKIDGKLSGD